MEHHVLLVHDQLMAERRAESREHALAKQAVGSGARTTGRVRAAARVFSTLRHVSRPRRAAQASR